MTNIARLALSTRFRVMQWLLARAWRVFDRQSTHEIIPLLWTSSSKYTRMNIFRSTRWPTHFLIYSTSTLSAALLSSFSANIQPEDIWINLSDGGATTFIRSSVETSQQVASSNTHTHLLNYSTEFSPIVQFVSSSTTSSSPTEF